MVQQFREREVQQSGQVPGYQNVTYSPDAFGASVGRALQSLGGSISDIGQMQAQLDSEKKANDVLVTAEKARDALRPVLYDPNDGIFTRSGQNAMDAGKNLNVAISNIQKNFIDAEKDPQKQQLLRKIWMRETEQAKDKVAIHEMNELGKYKAEASKATMFGAIEDAYNSYNDDKTVDAAISRTLTAIEANANGLPAEALELMKTEARSNIRVAAISRWAAEDPSKALEYYEAHKDDLSGKDHIAATQFVKAARKHQLIQQHFSGIVNAGDPTFFRQNIVPAESSNNPAAVSHKNAVGLSQLTLPTARDMAKFVGRPEIAALSDAELKQKLIDDPELNLHLGEARWNQQLKRLGGDVEAALVAYNAGPEAADAFLAHNAGKSPGERDFDVPGWKGIKNESEAYVKKILGGMRTRSTPPGQRMTKDNWTLKNFKPEDLTAPTDGGAWVDARAAQGLDQLADTMAKRFPGLKVKINEERSATGVTAGRRRGTSDPKDNPHVRNSQHIHGTAFDVQVQGWSDEQKAAFLTEARNLGFTGIGFYGPSGHLHIDMGPKRSWGRIPPWARQIMRSQPTTTQVASNDTAAVPPGTLGANDSSGYFINTKASALSEWMAKADAIDDPEIRAGVQSQVKIAASVLDAQRDAEAAAAKQAAWDVVANGGSTKDFSPAQLAQLDPSFINTLAEFENKRTKGDTSTDWNAYAQLQAMSEEELVKTDIMTEYATKLGPVELKGELNRQREARNKAMGQEHDEALLAHSRTRAQIISDIAAEQGWDTNSKETAQLNRVLGDRIAGEQAIIERKLTEAEIVDIADKLLIEDKYTSNNPFSSGYYTNQGVALGASDPNTFVAASEWTEVQPDDQKTLIDYYERQFGDVPDEEQAVDLYNRAMRVWLGGTPDGPEDEKTALRTALDNRLGRPLTDEHFERAYAKYLLSFLGR